MLKNSVVERINSCLQSHVPSLDLDSDRYPCRQRIIVIVVFALGLIYVAINNYLTRLLHCNQHLASSIISLSLTHTSIFMILCTKNSPGHKPHISYSMRRKLAEPLLLKTLRLSSSPRKMTGKMRESFRLKRRIRHINFPIADAKIIRDREGHPQGSLCALASS